MRNIITNLVSVVSLVAASAALAADPVAVATPAPAAPAEASTNGPAPKIAFASPVYDFGKVKSGDPVKYTFIFTNTGDALLEVANVQPSCGCTTAGEWSRKVEAGQTGTIPVQFNSANYNGSVVKTVTVTCNDKSAPTTVLQLKGTIWKPIDVSPNFAVLNVPPDAVSNVTTVVRIINNMEEPLSVWDVESNNKAFIATMVTNTPGKEYTVNVSAVAPFETPGNIQGQITVKSSATNSPVLTVTAWANIQPAVVINPPQLVIPAGLTNKHTAAIGIQNNSSTTITLSEPTLDAKDVQVQISEPTPGRSFVANLTFPEGFEIPQGSKLELNIKSTSPKMPVIKVPISQAPRPAAAIPVGNPPTLVPINQQHPSAGTVPPPAPVPVKTATQ